MKPLAIPVSTLGLFGNIRHPPGFCNIANGYHQQIRIPFFEGVFKFSQTIPGVSRYSLASHFRAFIPMINLPYCVFLFGYLSPGWIYHRHIAENDCLSLNGKINPKPGVKEKPQFIQVFTQVTMVPLPGGICQFFIDCINHLQKWMLDQLKKQGEV